MAAKRKAGSRKAAKKRAAKTKAPKSGQSRKPVSKKKSAKKKPAKQRKKSAVEESLDTLAEAEGPCTVRQVKFAYELLATPDLNATKAALAAGCPIGSAKVQGSKWLSNPNVQDLVAELKAQRAERVIIDADDVLRKLKPLAMSNITDLIVQDEKDKKLFRLAALADLKKLPREVTDAILSIKSKAYFDDDLGTHVTEIEFKLHPKVAALGLVGKHIGVRAFEELGSSATPMRIVCETGIATPPGGNVRND